MVHVTYLWLSWDEPHHPYNRKQIGNQKLTSFTLGDCERESEFTKVVLLMSMKLTNESFAFDFIIGQCEQTLL